MDTPNPNGFKVRETQLLRKRKVLVREIERAWSAKLPARAVAPLIWGVVGQLVSDLAGELPETLATALRHVVSSNDFKGYIHLSAEFVDPTKYGSARGYFAASSVLSLFKKLDVTMEGFDPEGAAIERFWQAEKYCRLANRRLRHYRTFDYSSFRPLTKRLDVHKIFHLARRKIERWLGPVNLDEILSNVRHGPGGCVGLKRPFTTPFYKFGRGEYTVSTGAYWMAVRSIAKSDAWTRALAQEQGLVRGDVSIDCIPGETRLRLADTRIQVADYNEVTFVPKNVKTLRSIAIEPRMNVALQLSVGTLLKRRLKAAGCDLTDQSRNQELARVGSLQHDRHDPVTLDLEMASDTMCIEIVRELLPPEWFELLDNLRSRWGKLDENVIEWEKFSSMGNGFTFELESMIFYALAQAVSDLTGTTEWFSDTFGGAFKYAYVSVFGDDIIVPKVVSDHLVPLLRFVGFRTNGEKSFTTGPFRESCGMDYYDGVLVRPFNFQRSFSRVCDLIHLHNGLKFLGMRLGVELNLTLSYIQALIPDVLREHLLGIDETRDDYYIWVEPDEVHRSAFVTWDSHHMSWLGPKMRPVLTEHQGSSLWRYVQFLYGNTDRAEQLIDESDPYRFPLAFQKSAGGSAGDVVLADEGRGALRLASFTTPG